MTGASDPTFPLKRVLVASYLNYKNFGDRLGFPVFNALLPANVQVVHVPLNFGVMPEGAFDLLIVGLGQSLNAQAILSPVLSDFMDRIPHRIGIFGTQYHSQYGERLGEGRFQAFLSRFTTWWARYETDVRDYGAGLPDVRHMGDWLVSAFPMTEWRVDKTLVVGAETVNNELPLDRMIQQIQAYRRVKSARLHTLLCALTSAETVAYQEQRETADRAEASGKFDAMLRDIFGRSLPENDWFEVDRAAVVRYKMKVEANMAALRRQIVELLA